MYKLFIWLVLSLSGVLAKNEDYIGHGLYEVKAFSEEQTQYLDALVERLNLDVWRNAIPGHETGLILVPRDIKSIFQTELFAAKIEYEVKSANIKEQLDLEDELMSAVASRRNRSSAAFPFDVIHRYDVINNYMRDIAYRNPRIVTMHSAGRSIQGRDINYLRISSDNFQSRTKPVIVLQSLLHAREWVSLPASLYAIESLIGRDASLVRNIDWIIMPIANPDGYEFTHTGSRLWRKNRRVNSLSSCLGVDLNRNFDSNWGTASSAFACSDTFHGTGPFSEPETQAIRNVLNQVRNRLELFIDIHSFGSMILYAYGNRQLPPNALILNMVGVRMAQSIDAVKWSQHPNYRVGNIVDIIRYTASGGASDWVQSFGNILSYTYELPAYRNRQDVNGFLVEPEFIRHAGFETWEGIKAGAAYVLERTRMKN
ncbi:zinc carboxypeptidase-like [Zerene cesonia]|uniref:zinc carboxypeptidase-like n=1 Tax=Zerene cesonia TaxID=33412 RepID=UPI0018E52ED2|nr:zinc carboxypeptidase-like [Zerene cesonia]